MKRSAAHFCREALLLACLVACASCDRGEPAASAPPSNAAPDDIRIVSLSPAISRTLIDLGVADRVVGRTPWCGALDQSIEVVGDLQSVNYELLARLSPTHVLVQPPAGGVDQGLRQVADDRGWRIAAWHIDGIADIRTMLTELPAELYEESSPRRAELARRAATLARRIDRALSPPVEATLFRGRVLMVNAVDPPLAFGSGTYLDDLLTALGAANAVGDRGWVQLSLEDVVRLAPEAVIIIKPNASGQDPVVAAGPLARIEIPAAKSGRFAIVSHADALLPSTGVLGVVNDLGEALRQLAEIPATMGGE